MDKFKDLAEIVKVQPIYNTTPPKDFEFILSHSKDIPFPVVQNFITHPYALNITLYFQGEIVRELPDKIKTGIIQTYLSGHNPHEYVESIVGYPITRLEAVTADGKVIELTEYLKNKVDKATLQPLNQRIAELQQHQQSLNMYTSLLTSLAIVTTVSGGLYLYTYLKAGGGRHIKRAFRRLYNALFEKRVLSKAGEFFAGIESYGIS
jgi:hypothetical protein